MMVLLCSGLSLHAQELDLIKNSDQITSQDSIPQNAIDSMRVDSFPISTAKATPSYQTSEDALTDLIDYGSNGRKKIDIKNKLVHLWDKAYVKYQDIQVNGAYIEFDFENNIAKAKARYNTHGKLIEKASFNQNEINVQYDSLIYNFKTKKLFAWQAVTKEGELFIHGGRTKYIGSKDSLGDALAFNENAIVTSCNHEHPHFGIRTKKLKFIPEKLAIIGPSRLEIADVPTPLWLPFGFFPILDGKSSGLILPKSYDFSPNWGFGLRNVGYYFPINDYMDARVTGDIYLRGSWGVTGQLNYKKRYKYTGDFKLSRSSRRNEDPESGGYKRDISYELIWTHRQDRKAHKFQSFNSSIKIQTAGFAARNRTDAYSVTRDNITSSVEYTRQFENTPFSLNAGGLFDQSLSTKVVTISAPTVVLNMKYITPFKRKKQVGKIRWYEKIRFKYDNAFKNTLKATDTTFYLRNTWNNAKYGFQQSARTNVDLKIFKYFNVNTSANYNETWFFTQVDKSLDPSLKLDSIGLYIDPDGQEVTKYDTTYGEVITAINSAFLPVRSGSINSTISTQLFWTEQRKRGLLRGFRHKMSPSLSMNYNPDSKTRFERSIDTDSRSEVERIQMYSIIPQGVFSASQRTAFLGISANISNEFTIKYYSKRDSTSKKIPITRFDISSSYNALQDSLQLSNISLNGSSRIFNRINLTYNMQWNPYKQINGKTVNQFIAADKKSLAQLERFTINSNINFTFSELRQFFSKKKSKKTQNRKPIGQANAQISITSIIDNFYFQYVLNYGYFNTNGIKKYGISTHTLNVRGNIPITQNWSIDVGSFGYDFKNKGLSYPDFGFSRNLHCWRMTFSWQPRGAAQFNPTGSANNSTFNFFIGVNPGSLDFVKYNHRKGRF